MMELRKDRDVIKGIVCPAYNQDAQRRAGKELPHSILAVERRVRMCLIPFLQQLNAKPLEEWMIAKKKILQLTADKTTDVSLNLCDELKVYAAKKGTF